MNDIEYKCVMLPFNGKNVGCEYLKGDICKSIEHLKICEEYIEDHKK